MVGRVPFVDGKVVVTGDGGDCWAGDGWVGVGSNVNDRRIGQKLHDHTHIILDCGKHHWCLQRIS